MREILYKNVIIRPKSESFWMVLIAKLLFLFNPKFLTHYWTSWFGKIYAPSSANLNDLANYDRIIEHEKIHILDEKKWKWWFRISYLFLPLPFFLCYGRFYWERKAYLPEMMVLKDTYKFPKRLNQIVKMLGGPSYVWAWPKTWIREWFLKKIYGKNSQIPFKRLKNGKLEESDPLNVGQIRMGRGHDTTGSAGMRQFL